MLVLALYSRTTSIFVLTALQFRSHYVRLISCEVLRVQTRHKQTSNLLCILPWFSEAIGVEYKYGPLEHEVNKNLVETTTVLANFDGDGT